MATFSFTNMDASFSVPTGSQHGVPIIQSGVRSFTATEQAAIADNDLVKFCKLPANHILEDFILDLEDFDQATDWVMSVGFLDTAGTGITAGTEIISASTTGRTGGVDRAAIAAKTTLMCARYATDKTITGIITTNPATAQASAKLMRFVAVYRPAKQGE